MKILSEELRQHYEGHLGPPDYTGKVVLDIGADIGTSAEFFLGRGASIVIAVEGNPGAHGQLTNYSLTYPLIHLADRHTNGDTSQLIVNECLYIDSPEDFTYLLTKWDWADIVKVDIEGSESHLICVPDDIFKLPEEYVIDFHSQTIERKLKEKLVSNGFVLYKEGYCNVIYAKNSNPSVRVRL